MLKGTCPKCGFCCIGWALHNPRHQTCPKCGVALEITDGQRLRKGYSPFAAEGYFVNPPTDITPSQKRERTSGKQGD